MNFFQIFVSFAVIAAVNMEVHPKTRSVGSVSGQLKSSRGGSSGNSGGSRGGSGHSGGSHGGSRGGSGHSGGSHGGSGGSRGGSGHSGNSHGSSGGSRGNSGHSGSSHSSLSGSRGGSSHSGNSHGSSGHSGNSHSGSHGGSGHSGGTHGNSAGSRSSSGHSGVSHGSSNGNSGHSGSSLGSSGRSHGGSSGNLGHSSSNSNSGNRANSQANSANSGSHHNNIGGGTQNSNNNQKTTSNTASSHSNGNGNININVGTSKVSGSKTQNSLGIDGSYSSKDNTAKINGNANQINGKSSLSMQGSKVIHDDGHSKTSIFGGVNKESSSKTQNHIGIEGSMKSKDGTGEIHGTAKQEGRKSSIGADFSKHISVNEHTNIKLDGSINKESSSKTQSHIGAEATFQSKDKTGQIIGKFERNNDENSFNVRAEKNIIDHDRGNLNSFAEVNKQPGAKTQTNMGIEGTLNSKDGTGKLKAGLSSEGGHGAWHFEGEKNLYRSDKVSIDANAGVKQAAGGKVEGQVGIQASIPIHN